MSEPQGISQELARLVQADGRGITLAVKVVPNASRNRLAGMLGDRLKVAVAAPPEDGKANLAVCELVARTLGVGVKQVSVVAGRSQPHKTLRVEGLGAGEAATSLSRALSR